jgi:membrane fusion protein (multidrug efflux system)
VATTGEISNTLLAAANARARHEVRIYAQTRGTAREVLVEEGQAVKTGDLLARLGDLEQELAVPAAAATVARLERERASMAPLVERGFLARKQLDELRAQLRSARNQLAQVRASVAHLRVRAPIDGIVAERRLDPGQQATPGQELFYLVDPETIEVDIQIPERSLTEVRLGGEAWVEAEAAGNARFPATVRLVGPVVNPQTGTVKVTLTVTSSEVEDNKGHSHRLRPGMFVRTQLITDRRTDAILIPKRAVLYDEEIPYVFTVSGGESLVARKVPVGLGFDDEARIQITDGIEPGTKVVTLGQSALSDGTSVSIAE